MTGSALLAFYDLTFPLGDHRRRLVVSATLEDGGVLYVRGPSGSGKSTLLRVLARLWPREGGELFLRGKSAEEIPPVAWRREVQYVPQRPVPFPGSVWDNFLIPFSLGVRKGEPPPDEGRACQMLRSVLLPPEILGQECQTLSGGELARVAVIRALLGGPSLLLLDEPTEGLDEEAREALLALLTAWLTERPGRGILWVSHLGEIHRFERVRTLDLRPREES